MNRLHFFIFSVSLRKNARVHYITKLFSFPLDISLSNVFKLASTLLHESWFVFVDCVFIGWWTEEGVFLTFLKVHLLKTAWRWSKDWWESWIHDAQNAKQIILTAIMSMSGNKINDFMIIYIQWPFRAFKSELRWNMAFVLEMNSHHWMPAFCWLVGFNVKVPLSRIRPNSDKILSSPRVALTRTAEVIQRRHQEAHPR